MSLQMLSIFIFALKIIVSIIFIFFTIVIGVKLLLEPRKGVCKCRTKLDGKTVLITGGNSGIGFETAKNLANRGARVIIASRNLDKSKKAVEIIKTVTGNEKVEYRYLNLAKMDSIKKFVEAFKKDFDRLDILVNNAGCVVLQNTLSDDGIDMLLQVNYVGPFLLTQLLLDKLEASMPSRIVIVSSYVHIFANLDLEDFKNCYKCFKFIRYSKSKLCDILWTRELAKRLPRGMTANALHPGLVKTNIFDTLHPVFKWLILFVTDLLFKTSEEGAQTVIHLCVSPELESSSGGYYKDCRKCQPSRSAMDDDLAKKLWEKTTSLIK